MPSKTPRNIWLNKLLPACLRWHFDTNLGVKEIPSDFPPFSPLSRLHCRSQTRWNWPWPRIRPAVLQMHARKPWKRWVPHIPLLIKFSTSTLELWKWGKGGGISEAMIVGMNLGNFFRGIRCVQQICRCIFQMLMSHTSYIPIQEVGVTNFVAQDLFVFLNHLNPIMWWMRGKANSFTTWSPPGAPTKRTPTTPIATQKKPPMVTTKNSHVFKKTGI